MKKILSTVTSVSDLYKNYLDGGEEGWFAFVRSEQKFYEWKDNQWEEVIFTDTLAVTSWIQIFENGIYNVTDGSTDTPIGLTGTLKLIVFTDYTGKQVIIVQCADKAYYLVNGAVFLLWSVIPPQPYSIPQQYIEYKDSLPLILAKTLADFNGAGEGLYSISGVPGIYIGWKDINTLIFHQMVIWENSIFTRSIPPNTTIQPEFVSSDYKLNEKADRVILTSIVDKVINITPQSYLIGDLIFATFDNYIYQNTGTTFEMYAQPTFGIIYYLAGYNYIWNGQKLIPLGDVSAGVLPLPVTALADLDRIDLKNGQYSIEGADVGITGVLIVGNYLVGTVLDSVMQVFINNGTQILYRIIPNVVPLVYPAWTNIGTSVVDHTKLDSIIPAFDYSVAPPPIGSTFQGGTVVYIAQPSDTFYEDGKIKGIISATVDLPASVWSDTDILVYTDSIDHTVIGMGLSNSQLIAAATVNSAAKACLDLTLNGFSDWFLGTDMEAEEQWSVMGIAVPQWTSNELNATEAMSITSTGFNYQLKSTLLPVRPMRYFSIDLPTEFISQGARCDQRGNVIDTTYGFKNIQLKNITLLSKNWIVTHGIASYTFYDMNIKSTTVVDAIPVYNGVLAADAGVYPYTSAYNGYVIFRSASIPTGDIVITLNIHN